MAKLILLSVLLASTGIPLVLSSSSNPRKALRRMQGYVVAVIIVWGFLCLHWYPTLVHIE